MPTYSDTNITLWTPDYPSLGGSSLNIPQGPNALGGTASEHLQNMKSVARAEALNKGWERWANATGFPNATFLDNHTTNPGQNPGTFEWRFKVTGIDADMFNGGPCVLNRTVKVLGSTGTYPIYGYISNITVGGGNTTVKVQGENNPGDANMTEVQFGTSYYTDQLGNLGSPLPHFAQMGQTTITSGNSSVVVTLPRTESDAAYQVFVQLRTVATNTNVIGPTMVTARTTTTFTVAIPTTAPYTTPNDTLTYFWLLFRFLQNAAY